MNHNPNQKNFNRSTAHSKSMMKNMVESFAKHNHITTTEPKGKALKALLQNVNPSEKLTVVKLGFRKGDNALMVKIAGERYMNKLNKPAAPATKAKSKAKKK